MARRRRGKGKQKPEPESKTEAAEEAAAPAEPAAEEAPADAPADAEEAPAADAATDDGEAEVTTEPVAISHDPAVSERILRACAGIHSFASAASDEAGQAAAPFLSFAQRSRIRALATDFESRRQTFTVQGSAPAQTQAQAQVVEGSALGREEIEAIVSHRIDIAVQEALQKLGVSPDATIPRQVERTVETQLNQQEQKLLDYVKRHLTDSLEMLESTLEERIADYIDEAELGDSDRETEEARAEIEAKVEEAREQLLKNIDEIREVNVGFDIANFASQIVEINDTNTGSQQAVSDEAIVAMGDEIELGGDDDEIELGGDEDDVEVAAEEVEVAAEEVEVAADEVEVAAEEVEAVAEDIEIAGEADDEDGPSAADAGQPIEEGLAAGIEDAVEVELGDDGGGDEDAATVVEPAEDEVEIATEADADVEAIDLGDGGDTEVEFADDDSGAAQTIELDDVEISTSDGEAAAEEIELGDEGIEEISIIAPVADDEGEGESIAEIDLDTAELVEVQDDEAQLQAGLELDLGPDEDGDDDAINPALTTLGMGPEDLQIAPLEDLGEVEIEVEDDANDEESTSGAIERYLQRAAEMRNRRQAAAAMELYSKVLDLDGDNYEARIGRGVLHLEGKDYKRAVDEFSRAEKIDASRPASALGLAEVHFHRKQFNKAIRHYTQCLKLDDKLAQAYCNRGLSYYYQKNYKKAFLDLMRAYDIDPELPNIKKYLKLVRNKVKAEKT